MKNKSLSDINKNNTSSILHPTSNINISKAYVNKRIPKNRFNFDTSEINSLIWLYKISYDTVGINDSEEYKEYQIFEIEFKEKVIKDILIKIQKAIPYPILFRVKCGKGISFIFAKGQAALETSKCLIENDELKISGNSIARLVYNTIVTFTEVTPKQDESLDNYIVRCQQIKNLTKEIDSLQRQVNCEKQPKKRIEFNEKLSKLIKELSKINE